MEEHDNLEEHEEEQEHRAPGPGMTPEDPENSGGGRSRNDPR